MQKPEALDFHLESRPCPKCGAAMLYDKGEPWDGPTWACLLRAALPSEYDQQDAARFRMLLQQHKHWLGVFRCDPDGAPSDSLDHLELMATLDQLIAHERSE